MPYSKNSDLPTSVKNHLPEHAQDIYREAFNNAWEQYKNPEKRRFRGSQEETSRRVAWAAVKRKYQKDGSMWTTIEPRKRAN
jgi:cation transport regulator